MTRFLIAFVAVCALAAGLSAADETYDQKKQQAGKQLDMDKGFLIFGTLPNSTGQLDGYVAGQLFWNPSLLSWIEFESTQTKSEKSGLTVSPLTYSNEFKEGQNLRFRSDVLQLRLADTRDTNSRFLLGLSAHATFDYEKVQQRYVLVTTNGGDYTAIDQFDNRLALLQGHGRLALAYAAGSRFAVQLYGMAGIFYGSLKQDYLLYQLDLGVGTVETVNFATSFNDPGWSVGGKLFWDFGPLALRLEGSVMRTAGSLQFLMKQSGVDYEPVDLRYRYLTWNLRAELQINLVSIGGAHPSLFFSVSRTAFEIEESGEWINLLANYDDETGAEQKYLYKFGVLMRF